MFPYRFRRPFFRPFGMRRFIRRRWFWGRLFSVSVGLLLMFALVRASFAQEGSPEYASLAYADQSTAQVLDLYLPDTPVPSDGYPVLIWVHGGGWVNGTNDLQPAHPARRFLLEGYAVASVEYRLAGEAAFPAQIYDVKAAVRWLRAHAGEYRLDTTRFAAMGGSAGGHLVSLLGTSGDLPELEDLSMGNADYSSRVQAVVDWFGPSDLLMMYDDAVALGCPSAARLEDDNPRSALALLLGGRVSNHYDLAELASPITHITADDPPFLIQQGTEDCTVPYLQSERFYDALVAVLGEENVTLDLLAEGHGGALFYLPGNVSTIIAFVGEALGV